MAVNYNGYSFFIDFGGEVEVFPAISTLTFDWDPDQEFGFYRLSIREEMPFYGADYDIMRTLEAAKCLPRDFIVKLFGTEVYRGVIKPQSNVSYNLRDCVAVAKVEPKDDYACLKENWESEFNLLSGTTKREAAGLVGTIAEITCSEYGEIFEALRGAGPPDACLTAPTDSWAVFHWTVAEDPMETPPDNILSEATWVREEFTLACDGGIGGTAVPPPGDGWLLVSDDCAGAGTSTWARKPALVLLIDTNNEAGDAYELLYGFLGGETGIYGNGVLLNDMLETFAPCSLPVVSDFFSLNPDATYPANTEYEEALENLASVIVYQKSDIRLPDAFTPAFIGNWDYKGLLSHLKMMFNVKPRIVSGALRLEHFSYWVAGPGLDLTGSPYAEIVRAALAYSYETTGLARRERWLYMEPASPGFTGRPIEYADCIPDDAPEEITYSMGRVNNDVPFIAANPDRVSDDGFVFMATVEIGGTYYIISEETQDSFNLELNGHMTISNLQDRYHRWDRLLPTGRMDGTEETFESSIERRVQPDFTIIYSRALFHSTFNPDEYVITELGNGKVARASFEGFSCGLTLSLKYESL